MGAQTPTDPKTHVAETRMASEPLNQGQENGTSQKSQSKTPIYYNSQPSHSSPIIYARAKRVGVWASTSRALGSGLPCFFLVCLVAQALFWNGIPFCRSLFVARRSDRCSFPGKGSRANDSSDCWPGGAAHPKRNPERQH